jgi:hypothetical protein
VTTDDIAAALARFEEAIPGWERPAAHGVGRLDGDRVEFYTANIGGRPLPAAVMATVCGHTGGSASYRLDAATLGRALELLTPAEACTAYDHPNLAGWRRLLADLGGTGTAVAVFVADLAAASADPHVEALRGQADAVA